VVEELSIKKFTIAGCHMYCTSVPVHGRMSGSLSRGHEKLVAAKKLLEVMLTLDKRRGPGNGSVGLALELVSDRLGRPTLYVDGQGGPAVSFSHPAGATWAAVSPDAPALGIDVSEAVDFSGNYPLHRVFHPEELAQVRHAIHGTTQESATLIWSAKEAVVKAIGCGFHLVPPLGIRVSADRTTRLGMLLSATLSGETVERYLLSSGSGTTLPGRGVWEVVEACPPCDPCSGTLGEDKGWVLEVLSFKAGQGWFSAAVAN
jgi:phosphopantetheinyl transferase (holo-ACP synthase)